MSQELPVGWALAKLQQLVAPGGLMTDGDWVESKDQDPDGEVRLLQLADVGAGEFRDRSNRFLTTAKARELNCTLLREGDVLITRLGDVLGKACLVPRLRRPAVTVVDVHVFRSGHSDVSQGWLMHLMNSQGIQRVLEQLSSGTTRKRVTGQKLKELLVPVPPAREQQRIVSRIEELFSDIAEGERALERVGQLVERYRQSVLKAAFTGECTQNWRWVPLGELVDEGPSNGYSPKADPDAAGSMSLKLTATTSGKLRLDDAAVKRLNEVIEPDSPLWLRSGDLLIQRANSLEHVGVAAVFDGPSDSYIYPDLMMRLRVHDPHLRVWLCRYLNSPSARNYFRREATGTAGSMPKISGKVVKALQVPVPPPAEMRAALAQLEEQTTSCEVLGNEIQKRKATATALRQSILKAAFSGQLVPQDPNDEPASALLARLAEQAATAAPAAQRRGRKPRSVSAA